jgi:FAD/FMN-containing dehydrogenase
VKGSWNPDSQRSPWCFVLPSTASEVSQVVNALRSAGDGAGDWHIAIRSGGHGSDSQNSITNGVIVDLSHLNGTTYDAATNVASVGTGSRWGETYAELEEHGVSITGGRQAIVGVGGLLLGGGVGWHTPRRGFGCDSVVNYEVVLANGSIVNANVSTHSDLWRALKGGSSNFGIVTRFDIEAFPAQNLTLERRTVGEEYMDAFVDAMVDFAGLDQSFDESAMASVISYIPGSGIAATVTEVNTANNESTTAFDKYNAIPLKAPSEKQSLTLPDAANVGAPELTPGAQTIGAGSRTIVNDPKVVHYLIEQHAQVVADLNATLGPQNFSTLIEIQPLAPYLVDISAAKGGNMLGLERNPRTRLYFSLGATLFTPSSVAQLPQVYQKVAAAAEKVVSYAESIGSGDDFVYLPYADASQNPLGSYGSANVQYMERVAEEYDPEGFFQRRVPGGFKLDRVT